MNSNILNVSKYLEHDTYALCVAFSPDGEMLAIGTEDKKVEILHINKLEIVQTLDFTKSVYSVEWSPDGKHLAVGCLDAPMKIWKTDQWTVYKALEETDDAMNLAWSSDGKYLAVGGFLPTESKPFLDIWDTKNWSLIENEFKRPRYVSFNSDSKYLVKDLGTSGFEILSLPDIKKVAFLDFSDSIEHVVVHSPSFSPDDLFIAGSCGDGRIRIWQTSDWSEIITKKVHEYWDEGEYGVSFSPYGKNLLSGGFGEHKLLSTKTCDVIHQFPEGTLADLFNFSWSPDSKFLALVLRGGTPVEIWEIKE